MDVRRAFLPTAGLGNSRAAGNSHGLTIDGCGVVFGDGHVHHGVTRELALVEAYGLLSAPILGDWLAHKRCQAYHRASSTRSPRTPRR